MHRHFSIRSLACISACVLLPSGVLLSQVKIKERVTIDPKPVPAFVASEVPANPSTTLAIPFEGDVKIIPTLVSAGVYPRFIALGDSIVARDIQNGNVTDLGVYPAGAQLRIKLLVDKCGPEEHCFDVYPLGAVKTLSLGSTSALFEIGDMSGTDLNGNPAFVSFFVLISVTVQDCDVPPQLIVEGPGEVRYGLTIPITARLVDGCGETVTPAPTMKFNFEIADGSTCGGLFDPTTGASGPVLNDVVPVLGVATVEYRATGDEPSGRTQDVSVTVSTTDPSITPAEGGVRVLSNDLRVRAVQSPIHFGESTRFLVELKNWDGTYSAIPSDWPTAFQLVVVDTTGYLYSPDSQQTGSTVYGTFQTASYYAKPRAVEPDSVIVAVYVTTVDPNVMPAKVNDGKKPRPAFGTHNTITALTKGTNKGTSKNTIAMDQPPDLGPGLPYYGVGRVVVKKKATNLAGFVVRASRDTLEFKQTADLTVIAVDKDNQEVAIDTSTSMILTFDDGGPFLDFIRAPGDTVETILDNVSYGMLRFGAAKVVAAKKAGALPPVNAALKQKLAAAMKSPPPRIQQEVRTDFPKSLVVATMASDLTKVGVTAIHCKPAIKVIAVQDSIKPFYPHPNPNYHNVYLTDTAQSRTKIRIAVTVSGRLYTLAEFPYAVRLSSCPKDSSGGHSHWANRPKGYFGDSIQDTVIAKEFKTGADTLRTSYLASMFGGRERIIAELTAFAVADTDTIVVIIPSLDSLRQRSSFVKVGGTPTHHGPPDFDQDDNHFGTATLITAVELISDSFAVAYAGYRLRINDMSLPNGGGFDLGGGWRSDIIDQYPDDDTRCNDVGHCAHRLGENADIGFNALDARGEIVALDASKRKKLLDIITNVLGAPLVESNHYHITSR